MLLSLLLAIIGQISILSVLVNGCGGGKKKGEKSTSNESGIKTPGDKQAVAGTYDPNYQTLAGVKGDCFGTDKANAPKVPQEQNKVAGTFDPNYQTLAGVGGDVFDKKQ